MLLLSNSPLYTSGQKFAVSAIRICPLERSSCDCGAMAVRAREAVGDLRPDSRSLIMGVVPKLRPQCQSMGAPLPSRLALHWDTVEFRIPEVRAVASAVQRAGCSYDHMAHWGGHAVITAPWLLEPLGAIDGLQPTSTFGDNEAVTPGLMLRLQLRFAGSMKALWRQSVGSLATEPVTPCRPR